jgi:hypothetical protein
MVGNQIDNFIYDIFSLFNLQLKYPYGECDSS